MPRIVEDSQVLQMVCLANSRKHQGRCIAGKVLQNGVVGNWVRPVSARDHEGVSDRECRFKNNSYPQVLDCMSVPVLEPRPKDYQTENWLLDSFEEWKKSGSITWDQLADLSDQPVLLWVNGFSSSIGTNDKVPLDQAKKLENSLFLIRVINLKIRVVNYVNYDGYSRKRVQGSFKYKNHNYSLWITDIANEKIYKTKPVGDYEISECYLTISLGEPYQDYCYKLVAAMILPEEEIL